MMKRIDAIALLADLLEKSGAKVTFSRYCRSGVIGDRCECHRCLGSRGLEPTEFTEAQARHDAEMIDAGIKFGAHLMMAGTPTKKPRKQRALRKAGNG